MKAVVKVGGVVAGYLGALLLAVAVIAVRPGATSEAVYQASSGMHAFSDALLFFAVFGVAALVPTGAALFFLRPYRRFWAWLSAVGACIALTGLAAVVLFAIGRDAPPSNLATWADVSVLRILAAPGLALISLVCAVFSPYRLARLALIAACVTDVAVTAYGGFVWIASLELH